MIRNVARPFLGDGLGCWHRRIVRLCIVGRAHGRVGERAQQQPGQQPYVAHAIHVLANSLKIAKTFVSKLFEENKKKC